jgi:hypothetical protein
MEVLGNHFAQLVVPFFLFAPQPLASAAAGIVIFTQLWLVASGNFAWLNWMAILLAFAAISDPVAHALVPAVPLDWHAGAGAAGVAGGAGTQAPVAWLVVVLVATVLLVVLSYRPAENLFSHHQLMNAAFNRWQLGNTYGAFGTVTKERIEIAVEGTLDAEPDDTADWREYGFRGKPGDVTRVPRQWAPYHLRLDWLMWFLPLGRSLEEWFTAFLVKLLEADAPTLRLLAHDPFGGERPRAVRVIAYRYRFATRAELRAGGARWVRDERRVLVRPVRLR